jgi:hypothetical protein
VYSTLAQEGMNSRPCLYIIGEYIAVPVAPEDKNNFVMSRRFPTWYKMYKRPIPNRPDVIREPIAKPKITPDMIG